MSSEWAIIIVNGIFDFVIALALFWIGAKASKIDSLEDRLDQKAEDLVSARFSVVSSDFKLMVGELRTIVQSIERRLERGDQRFDDQGEAARLMELKFTESREVTRSWAVGLFATKAECAAVSERLQALEINIARFEGGLHE